MTYKALITLDDGTVMVCFYECDDPEVADENDFLEWIGYINEWLCIEYDFKNFRDSAKIEIFNSFTDPNISEPLIRYFL